MNLIIWKNQLLIRPIEKIKMEDKIVQTNNVIINQNILFQTNITQKRLLPQQQQHEENLVTSPITSTIIDNYFSFDFNDINIYINSHDLLNLSIGLTQQQQKTFLSLNINTFRKKFDDIEWNIESYKMKSQPNAGGGSFLSEIFSCEIITRILNVQLFKTEMEIDYFFINQPMTDYL
ncbi:hypothetical protein C1645_792399, partial [Glomus cerebriforme]